MLPTDIRALWRLGLTVQGYLPPEADAILTAVEADRDPGPDAPLTGVQLELVRQFDAVADTERNILLSAPTSSGKTTLAQLLLVRPLLADPGRVRTAYLAPTKALAHAFHRDLKRRLGDSPIAAQVLLSTSDAPDDDWRIAAGDFSVACMVYEKAPLLLARPGLPRSRLALAVVDELHMLAEKVRGPALEMTLAKLRAAAAEQVAPPVRLVAISTEPQVAQDLARFLMVPSAGGIEPLPPIVAVHHGRPVPVRHALVVPRGQMGSSVVPIHEFPVGSDGRTVPKERIDALLEAYRQTEAPPKAEPETDAARLARTTAFVRDWLEARPTGHAVLVACALSREVEAIVDGLKPWLQARRAQGVPLPPDLEAALGLLEEHPERRRITELAALGLFEHYGDVVREVRTAVEAHFARVPAADEPTRVLFATDTLAYGVNLAFDTVILTDILFVESPRVDGYTRMALAPARFHNLVGRAGRLGRMRTERADVFIVTRSPHARVDANGAQSGGWMRDVVLRYYERPKPLQSVLFHKSDRLRSGSRALAATLHMTDPWVRAVLECVRGPANWTPGGVVSEEQALRVLDHTVLATQGGAPWPDVIASARVALQGLADPGLGLLTAGEDGLRLTAAGEGMLETGTPHTAVAPLQADLGALVQLWRRRGEDAPPGWLTILPLLLEPGLLQRFGRLLAWEAFPDDALVSGMAGVVGWKGNLRAFAQGFGRALADWVRQRAGVWVDRGDRQDRSVAVLRLWVALYRWAHGAPLDDVRRTLHATGTNPVAMLRKWPTFVHQMGWRILFLPHLEVVSSVIREGAGWYPALTQRMGVGLVAPAVPFVLGERAPLRRHEARKLMAEGWSAARVLRERPPAIRGFVSEKRMPLVLAHLEDRWRVGVRRLASLAGGSLPASGEGDRMRRWWLGARERAAAADVGAVPADEVQELLAELLGSPSAAGLPVADPLVLGVLATLAVDGVPVGPLVARAARDARPLTVRGIGRALRAGGTPVPLWLDTGAHLYLDPHERTEDPS
jgi:hypothetical protein